MSISGTDAYAKEPHLPPLVERALAAARATASPTPVAPNRGVCCPPWTPTRWRSSRARPWAGAYAARSPRRPRTVFVRVAEGVEGLVHRDTLVGSAVPGIGAELSVEVSDVNLHRRRVVLRPAP